MNDMRKRIVPGEGPKGAKIMIVGEAPGYQEDRALRPFVGQAGDILNRHLQTVGIIRAFCYTTNVVKTRPHKNDISEFITFGRNLSVTPEYVEFEQMLANEIRDINPNLIIAFGNVPLYALTRHTGITKYRGSILESTLVEGKKVLPIIHPAAALRTYMYNHYILADLMKAKKESAFPDIRRVERNLILNPNTADSLEYINSLHECKQIAFDIEVVNLEVSAISFARSMHDAICISFMDKTLNDEKDIWHAIGQVLPNPSVNKVAQNLYFDFSFLFRKYGIDVVNFEDTMIMQACIFPDYPKGLDFLCSIYTSQTYYKDDLKKYAKQLVSDEVFWRYNALDSAVLLEALPIMQAYLEKIGNTSVYNRQKGIIPSLVYMGDKGTLIKSSKVRKESDKILREIESLKAEFNQIAGEEINVSSVKQLKNYFYVKKNIHPYKSIKGASKGKITTDDLAMRRIARRGHREAKIVLDIRHKQKYRSTYLEGKISPDSRIRAGYNPVGTRQGRLSSSQNIFEEGNNRQNEPPAFKALTIPDMGYLGYNIDLAQAENRLVAYLAPDPNMIEAFEKGIDIHRRSAAPIFGIPEEDVSDEKGSAHNIGDGTKSQRFWGKKSNHSFNYHLSAASFALTFELQQSEGKRIRDAYLSAYPGLINYWNKIEYELKTKQRTLTNPFGRVYRFQDRWGHKLFQQAYSFKPQSTVADIINGWGLFEIQIDPLLEPVELLNQVHDSIVFQLPISIGYAMHEKIIRKIVHNLQQTINIGIYEVSIPADVEVGINFGSMQELDKNQPLSDQIESFYNANRGEYEDQYGEFTDLCSAV